MIKSMFFNSLGHDRRYGSADWAEYFASFVGNGIFAQSADTLQVVSGSNMTIKILQGKGWINGYYLANTSDFPITLANADGIFNRIDRVVLRLDLSSRTMSIAAVKGEIGSGGPVLPLLIRDGTVYELGLAIIDVKAGTTTITQDMITDTRFDESICGVVTGLVEKIKTEGLFSQYDTTFKNFHNSSQSIFNAFMTDLDVFATNKTTNFDTWFESIKNQLSTDAAGNLQNQINTNTAKITDKITDMENGAIKTNAQKIQGILIDVTDIKRRGILMYDGTNFVPYNNTLNAFFELGWSSSFRPSILSGTYTGGLYIVGGTGNRGIGVNLRKYSGTAIGVTNVIGCHYTDLFEISRYKSFDIIISYSKPAITTTARAALRIYNNSDTLLWSENLTPNIGNIEKTLDVSTLSGLVRLEIFQESGSDYSESQEIETSIETRRLLFWG